MAAQEGSIPELQAELGTSLVAQLTADEQRDLAALNPRLKQLEVLVLLLSCPTPLAAQACNKR